MKTLFITMCAFLLLNSGFAQPAINTNSYTNAIGLRAGGTSGLTFKHHYGSGTSAEFILGIWNNGFGLTGLYEKNANAGISGLNWYYGFGGHVAASNNRSYYYVKGERGYFWYRQMHEDRLGIGVDGIVGIEYKIRPIPFAISFDLKPFIEVTNSGFMWASIDPGLGIKFTF